jgi:hypothetical protein
VILYGLVVITLFLGFRRGVIPTLQSAWRRYRGRR